MPPKYWPTSMDYSESIIFPRHCLGDPDLKSSTAAVNKLGTPQVWSGQFARVFKMQSAGKAFAVRCFTGEVKEQRERYAALSQALKATGAPACLMDFEYIEDGIWVKQSWYPIVKMKWSAGQTLDQCVETLAAAHDRTGLRNLAQAWLKVTGDLRHCKIAHNDLQHENILVADGQIQLVDYDGFFVPALAGRRALESGVPHYQHPARKPSDFNAEIDNFSALVIYLSLLALALQPELWARYHQDRRLILGQEDYLNPNGSRVIQELLHSADGDVRQLAQNLAAACQGPVSAVPSLDKLTGKTSSRQPPKNPFYFRNGKSAQTVEELVRVCEDAPTDALYHFTSGHFEPWLGYIGRPDLAKAAAQARQAGGMPIYNLVSFLDQTGVSRHRKTTAPAAPK
jgi:hypothetical protein